MTSPGLVVNFSFLRSFASAVLHHCRLFWCSSSFPVAFQNSLSSHLWNHQISPPVVPYNRLLLVFLRELGSPNEGRKLLLTFQRFRNIESLQLKMAQKISQLLRYI